VRLLGFEIRLTNGEVLKNPPESLLRHTQDRLFNKGELELFSPFIKGSQRGFPPARNSEDP